VILAATLTLLWLITGFSFSMAATANERVLKKAEANAIATEYHAPIFSQSRMPLETTKTGNGKPPLV
jgi:hypothetical protein